MTRDTVRLELSASEWLVLKMLAGLGASAFDAPGGPAYAVMRRIEEQYKVMITTDDIVNVLNKIQEAKK